MVIEQSPDKKEAETEQQPQTRVAIKQEDGVASQQKWKAAVSRLKQQYGVIGQQRREDSVVSKQKLRSLVRESQQGILSEEQQGILKESSRRVAQFKSLARVQRLLALLAVKPKVWDANPWLLGTKQGVIDLRTGTLRPGRPDDSIRTVIPTMWKGLDEPAPRFEQFLHELFADCVTEERNELIAFLQRVLGSGLTGISSRVFLQFYSEGENSGKGTLMRTLMSVLGKVVGEISQELLIADGHGATQDRAHPRLCNLQGKRIAWASEASAQACFAIDQIKWLTNGKEITTRNLYGGTRTFQPSHLLILLSERKAEADIADCAFWEHLCPIVFKQRFVRYPAYANEQLCSTALVHVLEDEASGILAWLVRGTLEWHRLGLAAPGSVRRVRQEWRSGQSGVQGFVYDCCALDSKDQIPSGALYRAYQAWAGENGLMPVDSQQFGQEITAIDGVSSQRTRMARVYQGIRLQCPEMF